jgi:hypothetical protein
MRKATDHELLGYFYMMQGCYAAMPDHEKRALHYWEENIDQGQRGTSRWPGWAKYIGPIPTSLKVPPKKKPISQRIRMQVFERDGFKCRKCGAQTDLTVDHIIPESKGGAHELFNFQTLCRRCNLEKGTKENLL